MFKTWKGKLLIYLDNRCKKNYIMLYYPLQLLFFSSVSFCSVMLRSIPFHSVLMHSVLFSCRCCFISFLSYAVYFAPVFFILLHSFPLNFNLLHSTVRHLTFFFSSLLYFRLVQFISSILSHSVLCTQLQKYSYDPLPNYE